MEIVEIVAILENMGTVVVKANSVTTVVVETSVASAVLGTSVTAIAMAAASIEMLGDATGVGTSGYSGGVEHPSGVGVKPSHGLESARPDVELSGTGVELSGGVGPSHFLESAGAAAGVRTLSGKVQGSLETGTGRGGRRVLSIRLSSKASNRMSFIPGESHRPGRQKKNPKNFPIVSSGPPPHPYCRWRWQTNLENGG